MKWPDEMHIHEVIGPRLERGAVVIETLTPMGQIALRLSTAAAAKLGKAIQTAIGDGFPDLPRFLAADDPNSPKSDPKADYPQAVQELGQALRCLVRAAAAGSPTPENRDAVL